jgi:hypothetical protein
MFGFPAVGTRTFCGPFGFTAEAGLRYQAFGAIRTLFLH